jgi:hypothetical protein
MNLIIIIIIIIILNWIIIIIHLAFRRNEYQIFLRSKVRPALKADNLTAVCEQFWNFKVSTSHSSIGSHGLLHGYRYFNGFSVYNHYP